MRYRYFIRLIIIAWDIRTGLALLRFEKGKASKYKEVPPAEKKAVGEKTWMNTQKEADA